jgi:hypothetical protein
MHYCCLVCFFDFRALRLGGGGGEPEEDVTEVTSSGSGTQFLLRCGEGEDSEGEGRMRGAFDAQPCMEAQGIGRMRSAGRCPVGSVTRRMHTRRWGIGADTLILGLCDWGEQYILTLGEALAGGPTSVPGLLGDRPYETTTSALVRG